MSDSVDLTDLEVITRFSLAVRVAKADRADVVAALRSDLAWLDGSRRASTPDAGSRPTAAPAPAPVKAAPVKKAASSSASASASTKAAPVKAAAAKKSPAKKTPAKKATGRR